MTIIDIRELANADLELVSGGTWRDSYKYCENGPGGNAGLVPHNVECGPTWGDLVQIITDTAANGKKIQQQYGGGGRPQ